MPLAMVPHSSPMLWLCPCPCHGHGHGHAMAWSWSPMAMPMPWAWAMAMPSIIILNHSLFRIGGIGDAS